MHSATSHAGTSHRAFSAASVTVSAIATAADRHARWPPTNSASPRKMKVARRPAWRWPLLRVGTMPYNDGSLFRYCADVSMS